MSSSVEQFNVAVKAIPDANTINYLHDVWGKLGVRIIYEKAADFNVKHPVYSRIMCSTFNRSCSFQYPGTILTPTPDGFKVISVPVAPPVTQYQSKFLYNNTTSDTPIISAQDGTTITMYYFGDTWVFSTHRGFDVGRLKCTDRSYADLIHETLEAYAFDFDKLDKNKCYTIGFNHEDFHPFHSRGGSGVTVPHTDDNDVDMVGNDAANVRQHKHTCAWFIQSVDIVAFNAGKLVVRYDDDIGLPLQTRVTFNSINDMFQTANGAYDMYKKKGVVNFGYLLRINNRDYLVESSLLRNIRNIFYSNKFNKLESKFDKRKYIIVNSFMDATKHEIFKTLFPRFDSDFKLIEDKVSQLVKSVVNIVRSHPNKFQPSSMMEIVALELYNHITKTVTPESINKKSINSFIYSTILLDTKYTSLIYSIVW
jgi:hypothetical protein